MSSWDSNRWTSLWETAAVPTEPPCLVVRRVSSDMFLWFVAIFSRLHFILRTRCFNSSRKLSGTLNHGAFRISFSTTVRSGSVYLLRSVEQLWCVLTMSPGLFSSDGQKKNSNVLMSTWRCCSIWCWLHMYSIFFTCTVLCIFHL